MSNPVSSPPEPWIERIWGTMRATYGASFDRQWQCPVGVEPEDHVRDLKATWGRQLSGFQQAPHAISYALENLPPHPPNLIEFRAIARRAPATEALKIEPPKADPERVRAELDKLRHLRAPSEEGDGRGWARRIVARHDGGERVSSATLLAARNALREIA